MSLHNIRKSEAPDGATAETVPATAGAEAAADQSQSIAADLTQPVRSRSFRRLGHLSQAASCSWKRAMNRTKMSPLAATAHAAASQINGEKTGRGLSQQAFGIIPKIKQVDDAITSDCQKWAFEVHPEVCFWALNEHRPMRYNKKTEGAAERVTLLSRDFPQIEKHLARPSASRRSR